MKRVAVYCGSRTGLGPAHRERAREVARLLVERDIGIVYGGGAIGLMGVVADTALATGGEVIGVIPQFLADREVAHAGCTELHVVPTMHERKQLMTDLSDAFLILSGGIGTLDELVEAFTWTQLLIHDKPIAILNVDGYYDHLLAFLDASVAEGFLDQHQRDSLIIGEDPAGLLDRLEAWAPKSFLSDSSPPLPAVFACAGLVAGPCRPTEDR